jgi:hypothetical protein
MSSQGAKSLAQMTGLSEAQISKEAAKVAESTKGRIAELQRLEAWLARSTTGVNAKTAGAFEALATTAIDAHPFEEAIHAFTRRDAGAGYAAAPPRPTTSPVTSQTLEESAKDGAHKMALVDLAAKAAAQKGVQGFAAGPPSTDQQLSEIVASSGAQGVGEGDDSRNILFEKLKNQMQQISQLQTLISNVYSTMHEMGMTAIRNTKA